MILEEKQDAADRFSLPQASPNLLLKEARL